MSVGVVQVLSKFEGGDGKDGEHDAHDPESGDDFGFGVALLLVMVVERAHQEDASAFTVFLFGVFEVAHLEDDTNILGEENPSDDGQEELFAHGKGQYCDDGADGERAGISHEYLGREAVVPQEADGCPDEGGGED